MYLNRKNIELINQLKAKAERKGFVFTQTNSRWNGYYLSACRIYRTAADRGKPSRAIWTGQEPQDFKKCLEAPNCPEEKAETKP